VLKAGSLISALVMLAGCVAGPNAMVNTRTKKAASLGSGKAVARGYCAGDVRDLALLGQSARFRNAQQRELVVFGFLLGLTAVWGGGGRASLAAALSGVRTSCFAVVDLRLSGKRNRFCCEPLG